MKAAPFFMGASGGAGLSVLIGAHQEHADGHGRRTAVQSRVMGARWPDRGVIASAANVIVGRGAYQAACRQYPQARLTLRQGIRVIEETEV